MRYMYFSSTIEGYRGPIMVVLDLQDPQKPVEVCKWWILVSGKQVAKSIHGATGRNRVVITRSEWEIDYI